VSKGAPVEGCVYPSAARVSRTPAEWRANYPPDQFIRSTAGAQGETWYYSRTPEGNRHQLAAEVYAIIPESKAVKRA
jgi:hypothetical protein